MDNMIFTSEVCGVVLIAPFDKISRPPCSTIRFIVFLSLFFRCFSPFSFYHRTFSLTTVFEDAVHGTEILNAHPRHENHNDRALELAKRHPEYLRLAGSDTHEDGDECRAGVLLPERVRDSFAYRRMIEGRCFRLWSPVFPELAAADEALRRAEPAE